jgi:outer membrane protein
VRGGAWALAFAVAGVASFHARAEGPLEIYRLAKTNDPRYRAANHEYRAVEKQFDFARAGFFPSATFDAERGDTEQNIRSSQNAVFASGRSKFPVQNDTLTIVQPIFNVATWRRYGQAEAQVGQAVALYAYAGQDLILRSMTAYFAALAASDNVAFVSAEKSALARELQAVQERRRAGLVAITALHDTQARHALVEAREIEAENERRDRLQALREITGRSIERLTPLQDEIPLSSPDPSSVEKWVEAALENNVQLRARRYGVEAARQEIERQRAGHWPTLNLVGTMNRRKTGGSLFGGGSDVDTTDIMVRLSVPIFSGGSVVAVTEEAIERYHSQLEEGERQRREVERTTRAGYQGVISGLTRVNALRQSVVSQESALQAKEQGYRSGLYPVLAVLDAQRDLFRARREYAQARYEYLLSRIRLKLSTGALAEDDVEWLDRVVR